MQKLILSYTGHDANDNLITAALPVLAESCESALETFRQAALHAFDLDRKRFEALGYLFEGYNFFIRVPDFRLRILHRQAELGQRALPALVHDVRCDEHYALRVPRIESLEAWFERTLKEAQEEAEDLAPEYRDATFTVSVAAAR